MDSKELWKKLMAGSVAADLNCFAYVLHGKPILRPSTICFASWYGEGSEKFVFDLSKRMGEPRNDTSTGISCIKNAVQYFDYILNRSCFKETFLNKNAEEVCSSFVEPDLSRSKSEVCAGLTAIRCSYEFDYADLFCSFVNNEEYPVTEDQAFLLCCLFTSENLSTRRAVGTGHSCLGLYPTLEGFLNTVKGVKNKKHIKQPMKDCTGFGGVQYFFGGTEDGETCLIALAKEMRNNVSYKSSIEFFVKEWDDAIQG